MSLKISLIIFGVWFGLSIIINVAAKLLEIYTERKKQKVIDENKDLLKNFENNFEK